MWDFNILLTFPSVSSDIAWAKHLIRKKPNQNNSIPEIYLNTRILEDKTVKYRYSGRLLQPKRKNDTIKYFLYPTFFIEHTNLTTKTILTEFGSKIFL